MVSTCSWPYRLNIILSCRNLYQYQYRVVRIKLRCPESLIVSSMCYYNVCDRKWWAGRVVTVHKSQTMVAWLRDNAWNDHQSCQMYKTSAAFIPTSGRCLRRHLYKGLGRNLPTRLLQESCIWLTKPLVQWGLVLEVITINSKKNKWNMFDWYNLHYGLLLSKL